MEMRCKPHKGPNQSVVRLSGLVESPLLPSERSKKEASSLQIEFTSSVSGTMSVLEM